MSKFVDLTGQRFGRLVVVQFAEIKNGQTLWICLCDCGEGKVINGSHLKNGNTQSCGCLQKERIAESNRNRFLGEENKRSGKFIDLTGQRFGRLVVIRLFEVKNHIFRWFCKCDCGKEKVMIGGNLRRGISKSCGCLSSELIKKRNSERIITLEQRKRFSEMRSGDKSNFWKGGVSKENQCFRALINQMFEYKQWVKSVLARDNYSCCECGVQNHNLEVHHIKPFQQIIDENNITTIEQVVECEELWNIDNGISLCIDCHRKTFKETKMILRKQNNAKLQELFDRAMR